MEILAFVKKTIRTLDLFSFIVMWNGIGGSKIANYSDFLLALTFKKDLLAAYEAAEEEAKRLNLDDFDGRMRVQVEPVIASSFMRGVLEEARIWAVEVSGARPPHDAPTPFVCEEEWLGWVIANHDHPVTICGPDGDDVIDDATLTSLLRQALRAERALAAGAGWLSATNLLAPTFGSGLSDYLAAWKAL